MKTLFPALCAAMFLSAGCAAMDASEGNASASRPSSGPVAATGTRLPRVDTGVKTTEPSDVDRGEFMRTPQQNPSGR